jgi:neutral ceramidase
MLRVMPLTLGLAFVLAAGVRAQTLRAAAAKAEITPTNTQWLLGYGARQSTGVHDPLFHRVLVLDNGGTTFVLAATDLCLVSPAFYDEVAAELQSETGIDRSHFWWLFTHTHSAPETGPPGLARSMMPERYTHDFDHTYAEQVKRSLIDAVKQAKGSLKPARLSVTTGWSSANINRRGRDPEGHISLGMNPDGPVDRQIGILRLAGMDDTLIAVVANYAMHGTALGSSNLLISGDAPGVVTAYVEEKLGAPMLYVNGAAGDIAPIYSTQSMSGAHLPEFKVMLGDRILAIIRSLGPGASEVRIEAGEKVVETPLRKDFRWDEDLRSYLRVASPDLTMIRLPVRFVTLGREVVLWAAPLELFCEIAMDVRKRSPFPFTFYYGYANGWLGYLPTRIAFAEGGYEVKTSPFTEQAEQHLAEGAMTYIEGLRR